MKKTILLCLFLAPAAGFAFNLGNLLPGEPEAHAQAPKTAAIQPFGSLAWDDSLLEAFQKLLAMNPEKLDLVKGGDRISLKGVSTKAQLEAKMTEFLKKQNKLYLDPTDRRLKMHLVGYKGTDGADRLYLRRGFHLEASPVMIQDVPFTVTVNTVFAPGIELQKPETVLQVKQAGYSYPLAIKDVRLQARSPKLAVSHKAIADMLNQKYGHLGEVENGVKDGQGNRLVASGDDAVFYIDYYNGNQLQVLDAVYKKLLEGLSSSAGPDQSSGL
ncbi:MAG: hypothetical protein RRB13_16210 [bacterium]|nr:hypothetical protein [bacterium]